MTIHLNNTKKIKQRLELKLNSHKILIPNFKNLTDALIETGDLFVVGGYIRDIALNMESRDIDMISLASSAEIEKLLSFFNLTYSVNRLGGFKIIFESFELDLWSINDNWAHKKKFLKVSNTITPENISKGAFFNFDALAYSLLSKSICFSFFRECFETNELKLMRKNIKYRQSNPTIEANILRALYLKKKYGFKFSNEILVYISQCLIYFEHMSSANDILIKKLLNYSKYNDLLVNENLLDFFNGIDENNFKFKELDTPNLFTVE